jgi:hypothetical protein
MQSPTPNRKGVYEIHDVPDRKVEGLKARGWREVEPEPAKAKATGYKTGPKATGYKTGTKAKG